MPTITLTHRRPPWYLTLPALGSVAAVLLPLGYLVFQSLQAKELPQVWNKGSAMLLSNTMLLSGAVLLATTLLALPLAWLTVRTTLIGRRMFSILCVLPLAIPGYVMAYALLSLGGEYDSVLQNLFGWKVGRPKGFWGAALALTAYNLPYMYLTLRAAMQDLDPSLEEAARSLGRGRIGVLWSVIRPQLQPAFLAGAMLVILHVVADFGVVSLMGFDTFSRQLWTMYNTSTAQETAPVAMLLLGLACIFIAIEMAFLRKIRLDRAGIGVARKQALFRLGFWHVPAFLLFAIILLISVIVPAGTVIYWFSRLENPKIISDVWVALGKSVQGSIPAAFFATLLAIPIATMRARYPSKRSFLLERLPFIGYATPALAFALSLIMLCTADWVPDWFFHMTYQTLPLLVFAYTVHFLAEAVGPVRSSMYLAGPRLEEASRSLGAGRVETFFRVTLPVLRHGLIVSLALVFLSCMKELPLTMLLAPPNFETLAKNVWGYTENVEFAKAAPHALAILIFSAAFVGVLLMEGRK